MQKKMVESSFINTKNDHSTDYMDLFYTVLVTSLRSLDRWLCTIKSDSFYIRLRVRTELKQDKTIRLIHMNSFLITDVSLSMRSIDSNDYVDTTNICLFHYKFYLFNTCHYFSKHHEINTPDVRVTLTLCFSG